MIYKRALRDSRVLHIAFQSLELVTACGISSNLCLRFSVYWKLASAEGAKGFKCKNSCSLDAKQTLTNGCVVNLTCCLGFNS